MPILPTLIPSLSSSWVNMSTTDHTSRCPVISGTMITSTLVPAPATTSAVPKTATRT